MIPYILDLNSTLDIKWHGRCESRQIISNQNRISLKNLFSGRLRSFLYVKSTRIDAYTGCLRWNLFNGFSPWIMIRRSEYTEIYLGDCVKSGLFHISKKNGMDGKEQRFKSLTLRQSSGKVRHLVPCCGKVRTLSVTLCRSKERCCHLVPMNGKV